MDSDKLRAAFPNTCVYKDQKINATFKASQVPAFLRDWILKKKARSDGSIGDMEDLVNYFSEIVPSKSQVDYIKDAARNNSGKKFLAQVKFRFDAAKNRYNFEIRDLGLGFGETLIEDFVWNRVKDDLMANNGGWGLVSLGYKPPEGPGDKGAFMLESFKNFCPYRVNLDVYRQARTNFTAEEWMDVLLGAIDYNPEGYENLAPGDPAGACEVWRRKHTMLTRLLPFVQPNLNLVELAPKGTGKSYLFSNMGKYGSLVISRLSRADLVFNKSTKQPGMVTVNDFIALDEIQSIKFNDDTEMQGVLKGYMESGEINIGSDHVTGSAGIILLGNIPENQMRDDCDMFQNLPDIFHESALLERFHGFIKGRNIPRLAENLKVNGWALNTEYFSEIMHLLHGTNESMRYRGVVEALVTYPENADTRDTEAVRRLCTAYLKLLFPHATSPEIIDKEEFKRYCLEPAVQMRTTIRRQLQIIDPGAYGKKQMAEYGVK